MSWFYVSTGVAVVAALCGYERLAELMLAAACIIGYMDTRLPRDISVTVVRNDAESGKGEK